MYTTSILGGNGGVPYTANCPPGEYITQWYGNSGRSIEQIGARCSDGTDLGTRGGKGDNRGGQPWSGPVGGPYKNFYGRGGRGVPIEMDKETMTLYGADGGVVNNFMGFGIDEGTSWTDSCPSGAAVGIFGRSDDFVDQLGIKCSAPSSWCVNNLEDPMCAETSAVALNQACAKNFTATCTNRKSELKDSTMETYCAANPKASICSCYIDPPTYIPRDIAGLAPCWNKACAATGYIPQNMRGTCPSITICRQEMGTSGDSNMLTNNVIVQNCGAQNGSAANNTQDLTTMHTSQQAGFDIKNPLVILFIIIIGLALCVSIYQLIKWLRKKSVNKRTHEETS